MHVKGVIFNAVEYAVVREHGYEAWDELLLAGGLDGAWASTPTYPDQDLMTLVGSAAQRSDVSVDELLVSVGRQAFAFLFSKWPDHASASDVAAVLTSLDAVIHVEAMKSFDGATPPAFPVERGTDGTLLIQYVSGRGLCRLAEGLILGCGDHFDQALDVDHRTCTMSGDDTCLLEVRGA
jgi:hypothetical protein